MHVLVLTQNNIAPPRYGGALRVAALLDRLVAEGIHVSVIRFRGAAEPPSPARWYVPIRDVPVPALYPMAAVAALTHLLSRQAEALARDFAERAPISLVQSDPPWAALSGAHIARRLRVPHVALSHNCETVLAAQFAPNGPARRLPFLGGAISALNLNIVRWAERRAVTSSALTLTPSRGDVVEMASVGVPTAGVEVLPNGTRVRRTAPEERAALRTRLGVTGDAPVAVFVGRLDYPPNLYAVKAICETIAPRCHAVTFWIVGANPPALAAPPNVRLIGAVERVDDYLSAADLSLVPLVHGSGTRLKILDSWAAGLPVLSTPLGASGLDYRDGDNIIIEADVLRFPERIRELFLAPAHQARLAAGAAAAAVPYQWETIGRRYVRALKQLTGEA